LSSPQNLARKTPAAILPGMSFCNHSAFRTLAGNRIVDRATIPHSLICFTVTITSPTASDHFVLTTTNRPVTTPRTT
jgi:hypothetical protein